MIKHTREEVFKETLKYFNGDTLAANVWIDKYALKDSEGNIYELTPTDMHRRLASEIARIESTYINPMSEQEIFDLIKDFKYIIPQGSPMAGIGNNFVITSLSNCFVVDSAIDSYGGIMHTDQEQVQLMKRRGGVGHDLSDIRPTGTSANGSILKGDAGMTLFMNRFSNSTREVAQDGRRGALMLSVHIKHPDAEKFIDMKLDTDKVTGANVSVKLDDVFMNSVFNETTYEQRFPISGPNPMLQRVIEAKPLWDKIIHNAWKSAEPGVLFWDTILEESPARGYGKEWEEKSTNPCFHPETLIETVKGRIPIKDITSPIEVYSKDENDRLCIRKAGASFISKRNASTLKITLRNGNSIQVTSDHKLYIHDKGWVEAKDIVKGDRVVHLTRNRRGNRYHGVKLTTQHFRDYTMEHQLVYIGVNGEYPKSNYSIHHKDGNTHNNSIDNLECMLSREHNRHTALNDNPQIHQIRDSKGKFISSNIKVAPKISNVPDNLKTNLKNKGYNAVIDISVGDTTDVYDIKVEGTHCLIANNMVAHNCGEIPLNPYDSCRLLAINLYSYVINPFTPEAYFDWDLFKDHSAKAQRLMDDIVDLEIEKLDNIINKIESDPEPDETKKVEFELWNKIRTKAIEGRRTGLGITAEGDMLAALGLKYGTSKATDFAVSVHKALAIASYTSSIAMAKERGPFKVWDATKDLSSLFLHRIIEELDDEIVEDWTNTGRRNIANLTIAPTGTTSLMTQTSSGIEPIFLPYYKRRRKTDDKSLAVFTDSVGDMWEEYLVFHHKFVDWFNINKMGLVGIDIRDLETMSEEEIEEVVKLSPYYKATSNDVDYFEKVRMQGEIQKWVDHSISVTVNVPKDTPVETVDKIYRKAWAYRCKGVTVYRDGSRSGVLISSKDEEIAEIVYRDAPKRPKTLPVDVYTRTALGVEKTVVVGILKGKPYEIFAFDSSQSTFPKEIVSGTLTRVKRGVYELSGYRKDSKFTIENIIVLMSDDEQFQTRDFSRSLRHGEHPKYISSDIDKSSFVSSFRRVISRVLKLYLTNEDVEESCPDCKSNLVFENGCKTCHNCGWSACT